MQNELPSAGSIPPKSDESGIKASNTTASPNLSSRRVFIELILIALLGGTLGGAGIIFLHDVFPYSQEAQELFSRDRRSVEQEEKLEELIATRWRKNAMASYAFCGSMVAGVIGFGGGLVARSTPRAASGFAVGVVLGAFAGAAGALLNVWTYELMVAKDISRLRTGMWTQMAAFVPIGLSAGMTVSTAVGSLNSLPRFGLLGTIAGFLCGFLYAPLVSVLFPNDKIELPIPLGVLSMFAWGVLLALAIGALVASDLSGKSKPKNDVGVRESNDR